MQIVSLETICMQCLILFSEKKNKKNISQCRLQNVYQECYVLIYEVGLAGVGGKGEVTE